MKGTCYGHHLSRISNYAAIGFCLQFLTTRHFRGSSCPSGTAPSHPGRSGSEDAKLEIMPLVGGPGPARRVAEDAAVVHAQEVRDAVAVLVLRLPEGHDAVHDAREPAARQEAQAVAHVDDGVAGPRLDELPALGRQREELEPPLRGEQKCEGPDVRVLVVADVTGRRGGLVVFWVAQEAERRERWARVRMVDLEARGAGEAEL